MSRKTTLHQWPAVVLSALLLSFGGTVTQAAEEASTVGRTPPRLSLIEGAVSFWRPGATDWAAARLNTALAPGDALYAGTDATVEVQIGARAFVRAGAQAQIVLEAQEPDFLQLKVTAGHAVLDVRTLAPGYSIELDTPNAAFTVGRSGYYRIIVGDESTTFITRRGGRATLMPAGGQATEIGANDQVVIEGTDAPRVATYDAPDLDDWDRWNYDRTDHVLAASSAHYLPGDIYGADTLDHYGTWRVAPTYGRVWVPNYAAPGWAPYSTGQWLWDPSYGWTWVDDAPWGWAPYHYGRWVYWNSYWAWAPGPVVVAPVYAPALVAFFGGHGFQVGVGLPFVSWVALGWGEPVIPWWGHAGFCGRPWWGGWGGPRVVNNTTIVNVFQNTHVPHAVVAVQSDRFGHGRVEALRLAGRDVGNLQVVHGTLPVKPGPQSLVPESRSGARVPRPSEAVRTRQVVMSRDAQDRTMRAGAAGGAAAAGRSPRAMGAASASSSSSPSTRQATEPHGRDLGSAERMRAPQPRQPAAEAPSAVTAPRRFEAPPPPQRSMPSQSRMDGATERSRPPAPPHFESGRQPAAAAGAQAPVPNAAPGQSRSSDFAREPRSPRVNQAVPQHAPAAPPAAAPAAPHGQAEPPSSVAPRSYAERAPMPQQAPRWSPHAGRSAPAAPHYSSPDGGVPASRDGGGAASHGHAPSGYGGHGRGSRGQ